MDNLSIFFDNAWRWISGLPEITIKDANPYNSVPDIDEIKKSQYSDKFTTLMNNRMVMGFFRYGNKNTRRTQYDYIASAERRIALYKQTGNLEHLADAANALRMEFDTPQHPRAYFKATDDGEHSSPIK
jgi:hypothetical protein